MSTRNSPQKQNHSNPITPQALPKTRKLRIGEREIRAMGQLLAQRLSEAEACGCLGIEPRSWYKWRARQRNSGKFAALLDALTGQKIAAHLANIEAGATGTGPHKRADWRASQAILGIVAPRYLPQQLPIPAPPQPSTSARTINIWLQAAHEQVAAEAAAKAIDCQEVKALPAPPLEAIRDEWTDVIMAATPEQKRETERRIAAGGKCPPVTIKDA
jgi:hypothetical protein